MVTSRKRVKLECREIFSTIFSKLPFKQELKVFFKKKKGHNLIYINVAFICFFRSKNNIPLLQCHIVQLLESSYGRQWRWTWPSKGRGQGYRERARDRCPIMVFISKTIWKWLELCVHWYFAPNVDGDSLTQKISVIFHKQPFYKKKQEIISFISRWYCIYISIQRDVISAGIFFLCY